MQTKPFFLALFTGLSFSGAAQTALIDRGGGLIYDDVLKITWLQDANLAETNMFGVSGINADGSMDWETSNLWIESMNSANYLGYDDWRLPTAGDGNSCAGGPMRDGYIYNCLDIEFGHLYYTELGNDAPYSSSDVFTPGYGVVNFGPFFNLEAKSYWTSTEYESDPSNVAYRFDFGSGGLDETAKFFTFPRVWAVRDGDVVVVPEPATLILLGFGLAGLGTMRRRG